MNRIDSNEQKYKRMIRSKIQIISLIEKPQTYLAFLVGFLVDLLVGALSGLPSGLSSGRTQWASQWARKRGCTSGHEMVGLLVGVLSGFTSGRFQWAEFHCFLVGSIFIDFLRFFLEYQNISKNTYFQNLFKIFRKHFENSFENIFKIFFKKIYFSKRTKSRRVEKNSGPKKVLIGFFRSGGNDKKYFWQNFFFHIAPKARAKNFEVPLFLEVRVFFRYMGSEIS